jgi:hypothetical protein
MTEVVLDRIHVAFTIMYSLPVSAAHGLTRRSVVVGFRDVLAAIYFVVVYRMFRGKITAMSGEYGD